MHNMETYNLALVTKKIYDSRLNFFSLKTLRDILEIKKDRSLYSVIRRLLENEVLKKIEKNKYLLENTKLNDFLLANLIYTPSYISFESALNFYGILSQFPYEVTSATSKKTLQKIIDEKTYSYIHLKKELFWGYEKKDNFLIALPEKALLDELYLVSKGLKNFQLGEHDFSLINKDRLKNFLIKFPQTEQFKALTGELIKTKDI